MFFIIFVFGDFFLPFLNFTFLYWMSVSYSQLFWCYPSIADFYGVWSLYWAMIKGRMKEILQQQTALITKSQLISCTFLVRLLFNVLICSKCSHRFQLSYHIPYSMLHASIDWSDCVQTFESRKSPYNVFALDAGCWWWFTYIVIVCSVICAFFMWSIFLYCILSQIPLTSVIHLHRKLYDGTKWKKIHATFHVVHEDAWWWYDKNNNNANGSVEPNKLEVHVPIDQYGSDGNTNSKQKQYKTHHHIRIGIERYFA